MSILCRPTWGLLPNCNIKGLVYNDVQSLNTEQPAHIGLKFSSLSFLLFFPYPFFLFLFSFFFLSFFLSFFFSLRSLFFPLSSLWVTGPGRPRTKRPMCRSPKRHNGQSAYASEQNTCNFCLVSKKCEKYVKNSPFFFKWAPFWNSISRKE